MKFETKAIHANLAPDPMTGSMVPPLYMTTTYAIEDISDITSGFDYTRVSNPTRGLLEQHMAALENGKYGVSFASGLSAIDAIFRLCSSGDHVICSNDVYGGVVRLFNEVLSRFGITVTFVDTTLISAIEQAIRPNTKVIWVETPSNPLVKITDLEAACKLAKSANIRIGVDATFATPYLLRPLAFGADIVMQSVSKYISGHNQLIGGIVSTNDEALYTQLKFIQKSVGAVSSPFDCWQTLLGIKTLPQRMDAHSANAMAIARFLEAHPKVARVHYPGLPSHPHHELAKRQMKAFGGMLAFELTGSTAAKTLVNSVQLCTFARSLGAVQTMLTHPETMTHQNVSKEVRLSRGLTDGLVRISTGIEAAEDIIADLEQALDKV